MKPHVPGVLFALSLVAFTSVLVAQESEKPLAFRIAVNLALQNSASSGLSRTDLERAGATVGAARSQFLPSVTVGSALGYSHGFPLSLEGSAPSLFDVNIQGLLFNSAQRKYIEAAKIDVQATNAQNAERRNDVMMETVLAYMQLDLLDSYLSIQREQQQFAEKFQDIAGQRVQVGLDSLMELTRAKLAVARTRLDIARTQAAADALRQRLSQLTGLPPSAIRTSTETIPQLPAVSQDDDLAAEAVSYNPTVKIAERIAAAKDLRAEAERKQLYPTVDLAGQYAVLAKYNNYTQYYQPGSFQRNNLSIGVVIRVPFVNPALHAAAGVAKFDAVRAHQEAGRVKEQVGVETLKLQRSVQEMAAAREVAQLEHRLAEYEIEVTRAKIESGAASLKDEENARVSEHERYTAYLSASFDLDKAQVQLLRQIGNLETWALGATTKPETGKSGSSAIP